jgi:acetyl-CoA synthetase
MLDFAGYENARSAFRWDIPTYFNIGVDVCDRWATLDPERIAVVEMAPDGQTKHHSYSEVRFLSNRLAGLLSSWGVGKGDRVALLLPQCMEAVVAHIAIYKIGAICVPLFVLFGEDALRHRLADSEACVLITDHAGSMVIEPLRNNLPGLLNVLCVNTESRDETLSARLEPFDQEFEPVKTLAEDPAILIYTSGTTGASKGALHAHRVLLGHLPGVEMSHDGLPQIGDRMWTPADWAWIGGLLDVLLPSLHHGIPVVAHRFRKFSAEAAYELMSNCEIRNVFLPPTALRMLRTIERPRDRWHLNLRSVASGGESLQGDIISWGRVALGVEINEFYGQTECNMVVSSSARWFPGEAGRMGRPVPGHTVAVLDPSGHRAPLGELGEISVLAPDPVIFLGYWKLPEATASKYVGDWLRTGDLGTNESDGSLRFIGRSDDLITSGGYRIGPTEIEECMAKHSDVHAVGVVGIPDSLRTEVVTAFVVLKAGVGPSERIVLELQSQVRRLLGAHQYPRKIRFVDGLPRTVTGKLIRGELRKLALAEPSNSCPQ